MNRLKHFSQKTSSIFSLVLLFSISATLFWLSSFDSQANYSDGMIILAWLFFLGFLCVKELSFIIKYSYLFFLQLSNLLGVLVIENYPGLYLRELAVFTADHHSLAMISWIHFLFFFSLYVWYRNGREQEEFHSIEEKDRLEKKIFHFIFDILVVLLILFLLVVLSKPAFLVKMDRFQYAQVYLTGYKRQLASLPRYLLPLLTIYLFSRQKYNRWFAFVCYGIYFVSLFLTGNKFGGFIDAFFLAIPYLLVRYRSDISKLFRRVFVVFLLAILVVFSHNTLTSGGTTSNYDYLLQRLAQQGQLWWAMYPQESNQGLHLEELTDEYSVWFNQNTKQKDNYNFGIYKIMRKTTPHDIVERKIASGSRYAGATYASLYYYFKEYLFVLIPLMSWLMYKITNWYYRAVYQAKLLDALVSGYLLLLLHSVYTQADYDILFGKKTVIIVVFYLGYRLLFVEPKKIYFSSK